MVERSKGVCGNKAKKCFGRQTLGFENEAWK
jgi:hypothetical protein